jgi:DtxR family Mn-dependent transcriptional regulator
VSPQNTDERYLRAIFQVRGLGEPVTTTTLARWLDVAAPSVSNRLRRLEDAGLLTRAEGEVRLTPEGNLRAAAVVRRHRLIETFLHRALGVPVPELHESAEALQDGVSEQLAARMDEALGYPTHDPHGDPIPQPGTVGDQEAWPEPLTHAPSGRWFSVTRISDREPEAIAYLISLGLVPGSRCFVAERAPFGGPLWVEVDGARHALSDTLVNLIFGVVEPARRVRR